MDETYSRNGWGETFAPARLSILNSQSFCPSHILFFSKLSCFIDLAGGPA